MSLESGSNEGVEHAMPFLDLPAELHLYILYYLPNHAILNLAKTFNRRITPLCLQQIHRWLQKQRNTRRMVNTFMKPWRGLENPYDPKIPRDVRDVWIKFDLAKEWGPISTPPRWPYGSYSLDHITPGGSLKFLPPWQSERAATKWKRHCLPFACGFYKPVDVDKMERTAERLGLVLPPSFAKLLRWMNEHVAEFHGDVDGQSFSVGSTFIKISLAIRKGPPDGRAEYDWGGHEPPMYHWTGNESSSDHETARVAWTSEDEEMEQAEEPTPRIPRDIQSDQKDIRRYLQGWSAKKWRDEELERRRAIAEKMEREREAHGRLLDKRQRRNEARAERRRLEEQQLLGEEERGERVYVEGYIIPILSGYHDNHAESLFLDRGLSGPARMRGRAAASPMTPGHCVLFSDDCPTVLQRHRFWIGPPLPSSDYETDEECSTAENERRSQEHYAEWKKRVLLRARRHKGLTPLEKSLGVQEMEALGFGEFGIAATSFEDWLAEGYFCGQPWQVIYDKLDTLPKGLETYLAGIYSEKGRNMAW